jgi:phosphomannomutase
MKKMNNIALFDMDGTLTPARQAVGIEMLKKLEELSKYARIGIVSGSGYEYIMEQIGDELLKRSFCEKVDILPCNGTQFYKIEFCPEGYRAKLVSSVNMREKLGNKEFNTLMRKCIVALHWLSNRYHYPMTGNFISNRGSLVNLCPIGRNANQEQRDMFEMLDSEYEIRKELNAYLNGQCGIPAGLYTALGGTTSIDIFPNLWDKRYALNHYDKKDKIYFAGDRCDNNGNDKALYDLLKLKERAWKTTGPEETMLIIDRIISYIGEKNA